VTILAIFLAMVGAADLIRQGVDDVPMPRRIASVVTAALVAVLSLWGAGFGWNGVWLGFAGLLLVTGWVFADRLPVPSSERIALLALVLSGLAVLAFGQYVGSHEDWLQSWYSSLEIEGLEGVSFERFALGVGCLLVLQTTSNLIVRLVLKGAGPGVMASAQTLKGGRILGPLERVFVFALALSGHFGAVGAIVAAKGILRFPEISRDDPDGNKAEYVLVGSFVSWLLALVFVPLF
jgi:hypothetical protein